jgi:uncharacterized protein YgbK (DUF1537 family)
MAAKTLIVADDLTGAQDTAIQLRRFGGRVDVALSLEGLLANWESSDIWAINTDSRFLGRQDAFDRVSDHLRALSGRSFLIYKKVDSTLRGNIGAEIEATLRATGKPIALLSSALPHGGRTIVGGMAFVKGVPVHETECGRDPFTAVVTSDVCELVRRQTSLDTVGVGLDDIRNGALPAAVERHRRSPSPVILVCDAETAADLAQVGRLWGDPDILFVGSSGLAAALSGGPAKSLPPFPFLVVIGSLNSVSQEQADRFASRHPCITFLIDAERAAADADAECHRVNALIAAAGSLDGRHVVLRCTPQPVRVGGGRDAAAAVGRRIADCLSAVAGDLLAASPKRILYATGGDLMSRFLNSVQADSIRLLDEAQPGVPFGEIGGGRLHGYILFSKAGGFGGPDMLSKIVEGAPTERRTL